MCYQSKSILHRKKIESSFFSALPTLSEATCFTKCTISRCHHMAATGKGGQDTSCQNVTQHHSIVRTYLCTNPLALAPLLCQVISQQQYYSHLLDPPPLKKKTKVPVTPVTACLNMTSSRSLTLEYCNILYKTAI